MSSANLLSSTYRGRLKGLLLQQYRIPGMQKAGLLCLGILQSILGLLLHAPNTIEILE